MSTCSFSINDLTGEKEDFLQTAQLESRKEKGKREFSKVGLKSLFSLLFFY